MQRPWGGVEPGVLEEGQVAPRAWSRGGAGGEGTDGPEDFEAREVGAPEGCGLTMGPGT